jgi:hypothetical protein
MHPVPMPPKGKETLASFLVFSFILFSDQQALSSCRRQHACIELVNYFPHLFAGVEFPDGLAENIFSSDCHRMFSAGSEPGELLPPTFRTRLKRRAAFTSPVFHFAQIAAGSRKQSTCIAIIPPMVGYL